MPDLPITRLLDDIHTALHEARYADLGPLTAALTRSLEGLGPQTGAEALEQLRRKAARNAACLQGAQRGLRAARRRISDIAAARAGLVTYGPEGRRTDTTADPVLARRF